MHAREAIRVGAFAVVIGTAVTRPRQIRFRTTSEKVSVRVRLSGIANMVHMPAIGQCGFDCYVGMDEKMFYCNTTFTI